MKSFHQWLELMILPDFPAEPIEHRAKDTNNYGGFDRREAKVPKRRVVKPEKKPNGYGFQ